jgi:hypothetical protein
LGLGFHLRTNDFKCWLTREIKGAAAMSDTDAAIRALAWKRGFKVKKANEVWQLYSIPGTLLFEHSSNTVVATFLRGYAPIAVELTK